MKRNVNALCSTDFDVLVVGAGITGAWIALDCVQRGLSVALIDRADFGAETSAKSSRVLHGGIRYLQQFQFGRVRESANERACYHQVAPHLSHYISFLIPTFRDFKRGRLFMACGMALYRLICVGIDSGGRKDKRLPAIRYLNRDQLLQQVPITDSSITGAFVLPESHMYSSERMTMSIIKSAVAGGAVAANYVYATDLIVDDNTVRGAIVQDRETGDTLKINSRLTINATGPWLSTLASPLENHSATPCSTKARTSKTITTGFSVGSHLVTRELIKDYAIAIPTRFKGDNYLDRGGRHIFILPWRGHSLIGTSYAAAENGIDQLQIQREEIDQLVGSIQQTLPRLELTEQDIVHSFSGIYPLQTTDINHSTYQGSGEYQIIDHAAEDGVNGLISSLGAKFTTARKVASKTVDLALDHLGRSGVPCSSHHRSLAGGNIDDVDQYLAEKQAEHSETLSSDTVAHLVRHYGTEIDQVVALCADDAGRFQPVGPDRVNIMAEIVFAVENEMCCHLEDVLYRRTGMGMLGYPGDRIVERCADAMAGHLGWDSARKQKEITLVKQLYDYGL